MKKLFVLTLTLCLLLTACASQNTQSPSLEVTSDIETADPQQDLTDGAPLSDLHPIVFWGDRAYLDMGKQTSTLPDGYEYAGDIISEVTPDVLPKTNGTANFECSGAKVYSDPGDPQALYIGINDGYAYFRLDINTEDLPTDVTESTPEADGKLQSDLTKKGTVGEKSEIQEMPSQDDYTVEITDTHCYGGTVTYKNNTGKDVMYKGRTPLQKLVDGEWHWLNIDPDTMFPMPSLWLSAGDTYKFTDYWENLYGTLENGQYRYVEVFYFEKSDEEIYAAAEFTVSDAGEPIEPGSIKLSQHEPYYYGISMNVDMASLTPTSAKFNITNNSTAAAEFDGYYSIWRKVDKEWFELKEISDNVPMTLELYTLPVGESDSFEINWESLYGSLPDGEYAIAKVFGTTTGVADFRNEQGGGTDRVVALAEFSLPAPQVEPAAVDDVGIE